MLLDHTHGRASTPATVNPNNTPRVEKVLLKNEQRAKSFRLAVAELASTLELRPASVDGVFTESPM
jgi:hypothetical protein